MKKIALISAIALSGLLFNTANAQIHIGFGIHINTPAVRVVAATPVYTDYTPADDYYYLPDVDAYYSMPEKCYYYNNGDNWVTAAYLPGEYRDYDWRSARHYEVRARRPYLNADVYRARYRGNAYNWGRYNNDRRYYARDDRRDNNFRIDRRDDHRGVAHSDDRFQRNFDRRQQDWSAPKGRNDNRQQNWNNGDQGRNDNRQQNRDNGNQGRNDDHQGRNDNRGRGNDSNDHFADYHGQSGHNRFRS
ncbi:MAG: hypothetical protein JWR50_2886 [Mucilaginibacter sp.]|nr:hypothetical protein [Mucilaginibacter sp.]